MQLYKLDESINDPTTSLHIHKLCVQYQYDSLATIIHISTCIPCSEEKQSIIALDEEKSDYSMYELYKVLNL